MLVSESIFDNNNIFILLYLKWKLTASFPLSLLQVDTVAKTTRLKKLAARNKHMFVLVTWLPLAPWLLSKVAGFVTY